MTTLGQIADLADCEHKTAPIDPRGEFYAVGTPAMAGNEISLLSARRISRETFEAWTRRMHPRPGDLLLAREAPIGPVVMIPPAANIAPGQRTVLVHPHPETVSPRYLHYLLLSPDTQARMLEIASGSTVPHLNVSDVHELELGTLPSMKIQCRVSRVLGSIDDKIAANRRIIALSDKLGTAIASQTPSTCALSNLAVLHRRSISPKSMRIEGVAHFSLPSFDRGYAAIEHPESIKSSKNLLEGDVVLVSKLNPRIPRVWAVPENSTTMQVASPEFLAFKPSDISLGALYFALIQPSFFDQLCQDAEGTSNSHQRVKPADICAASVPDVRGLSAPSASLLDSLCRRFIRSQHEIQILARTRDELLPLLMSGKITVKDAEKTVEEVV